MLALGDTALQTRIEGITGEEGQELRLALVLLAIAVFVAEVDESGEATNGLCAGRVDMVDVVVMDDSQVGLRAIVGSAGEGSRLLAWRAFASRSHGVDVVEAV